MAKYDHKKIEKKWQKVWGKTDLYRAEDFSKKPKFYCLIEFPYPSGEYLHVGHGRSYTALDTIARIKRMQGYNVLYPIGWDAFGLPTENYAIKTGIHPSITTKKNIENSKRQLISWGCSFDWDREINTTDPKYYKWTQWIFLKLYEMGLAYKAKMPINWCPSCKIGLANEEVVNGACERCETAVGKREIEQWMLKITAYADRLLHDLEKVDFLPKIKTQQVNWIGRKEWIDITYPIGGTKENIVVSTTRPDTNFGATFVVLAPEHPIVESVLAGKFKTSKPKLSEIKKYAEKAKAKSELERISEGRKKTGVFTGLYATNQLNGYKMPIWITDFVLMNIGTGAVVGVPGSDIRDFEFAQQFKLPIIRVVVGEDGDTSKITRREQVQEKEGVMINSEFLDGLDVHEATKKIMDYIEKKGWGKRIIRYHLRDWIFSRQHYWGEPIPIIHCEKCGMVPVPEKDLPVELPMVKKYQPTGTGESPLAAVSEWVSVKCPKCGGDAKRETDTMPNWAGSSWYFIRYIDPKNDKELADKKKMKYWLPVDLYNGGMEHTTLHLLYSRFWYKALYDAGVVPNEEPYARRHSHGVILGPDNQKMSKSRGNVVSPDEMVAKYGADTFRMYEMFIGPFEDMAAWSFAGIEGVYRFINRVWNLFEMPMDEKEPELWQLRLLHKTIKKVTDDTLGFSFNTAVSGFMIFINELYKQKIQNKKVLEVFTIILAPFAPHMAEELWEKLGNKESVHIQPWPKYDPKMLEEDIAIIVIQVNGRVRANIEMPKDADQKAVEKEALAIKNIQKHLASKEPKKIIYVQNRILNIVI